MSFTNVLGFASILVATPSALVAWQDYKLRRASRLAATSVVDVRAPVPLMPQPVAPAAAPLLPRPMPSIATPVVTPLNEAAARATAKLGTPLSFPRRLLAGVIDLYGTYFVAVLLALAVADPTFEEDAYAGAFLFLAVVGFVGIAALNANGRSPGKMVVGASLVRYSDRSLPVSFWRSVGRFALALIVPLSSWFVLGASRRALHDRMTDTLVIRTR